MKADVKMSAERELMVVSHGEVDTEGAIWTWEKKASQGQGGHRGYSISNWKETKVVCSVPKAESISPAEDAQHSTEEVTEDKVQSVSSWD